MKQLNKKQIKELNDSISKYEIVIDLKNRIFEKNNVIISNDIPILFRYENKLYPTLKTNLNTISSVYVDRGAIPFLLKGADLMRRGITNLDNFEKDELIVVRDETYKKAICLGIALLNSIDMKTQDTGKSIKIIHFVGDNIWNL